MKPAALLLTIGFLAGPAWSQSQAERCEAAEKAQRLTAALTALYLNGCLGRDGDKDALAAQVGKELSRQVSAAGAKHSAQEQKQVVVWTLGLVKEALREGRSKAGAVPAGVLDAMSAKVDAALAAVLDAAPLEKNQANAGYWQWDSGSGRFPGAKAQAVDLSPLQKECAEQKSDACADAFEAAKLTLRTAALVERAFTFQTLPVLEEARQEAARRNRMWHAYFDDARVQLPHELALNSYLYRQAAKKDAGFAETPRYQVIFLHPSAGLQYIRSADAGSRFEPALLLEIAGINGWKWKDDGSMSTALGASLVWTYSDRAGTSGSGGGIALHVNHRYSLSFTRHDGRLGITLSTDLARLLTKPGDQDRAEFRFGKKGEAQP
jgi:hypothetical protein